MINEEVTRKAVTIEIKLAKASAKLLLQLLKKLEQQAKEKNLSLSMFLEEKVKGSSIPLKDLVKKGQLESITVADKNEFKEIKKELNRYGVKFSVMKDKESGE